MKLFAESKKLCLCARLFRWSYSTQGQFLQTRMSADGRSRMTFLSPKAPQETQCTDIDHGKSSTGISIYQSTPEEGPTHSHYVIVITVARSKTVAPLHVFWQPLWTTMLIKGFQSRHELDPVRYVKGDLGDHSSSDQVFCIPSCQSTVVRHRYASSPTKGLHRVGKDSNPTGLTDPRGGGHESYGEPAML